MNSKHIISVQESSKLCKRLEGRLAQVFNCTLINSYLIDNEHAPELQILGSKCEHSFVYPQVKLAFDIWLAMEANDRYRILRTFQQLYSKLGILNSGNLKTLLFCTIFIHEFTIVLVEKMYWPN